MVVRRMKTYTAATGYVYQYYFVGKREAQAGEVEGPATEFVFDVTPDRKTTYAASVFLLKRALDAWAAAHGRSLSDTEQYAAAKLRLFQGFDEVEDFAHSGRHLVIDAANLEELLGTLGVE
jgi:hypothetical protein